MFFFCFFHLALPFLVSSFVVRKHDDIYLIIYRPMKCYVYQEIGRKKINQLLKHTGVLEWR